MLYALLMIYYFDFVEKQQNFNYGDDVVTPNMHMHCHLAACLREFGPSHSFWLFPFEQYNGILEKQPSNNRSIEIQLMRRFQNHNLNLQLCQSVRQRPEADIVS